MRIVWRRWSNATTVSMSARRKTGRPRSSGGRAGQPLPQAHRVVREVAEEAAGEGGQLRVSRRAVAPEMARERLEGAPPLEHGPVGPEDPHLRAVAFQDQAGIPAEDREARDLLRALHALEEEARGEVAEAQVGGDRGLEVGEQLARDGHHVGGARPRGAGARGGDQTAARRGSTSTAPFHSTGASGLRPSDGLRPVADAATSWSLENQKSRARGTLPLTSALTHPALATSGDRYAGPGPSWAQGRHQRHAHQRCPADKGFRAPVASCRALVGGDSCQGALGEAAVVKARCSEGCPRRARPRPEPAGAQLDPAAL